ncbi:MAG: hypothetical protein H0W70_08655 [Actinobacteria bacterium]|nr:hypothetical protein [Actinomycetota bacterium]
MKRLIRQRERRRVVATLKSGSAFYGVLYATDPEAFVLRDATAHQPGQEPVAVDGEVLILRADLDYLQLP